MPANLPPQYHRVEQKYRQAKSIPEKIAALQEMLAVMPKHKGTDHLKASHRAKMAQLMEELSKPRAKSGGGPQPFNIRKEGAGQALIIGFPNSGKSSLLSALTGASTKIGNYPFTTLTPLVGMLPFENIQVQLIDAPSLNYMDTQTRLFGLLRQADLLLVVVDLSADPLSQLDEVMSLLDQWGFSLLQKGEEMDPEGPRLQKPVIIVANKADLAREDGTFNELDERCGRRFRLLKVSCLGHDSLDVMGPAVFQAVEKVRVYTRPRGGQADLDVPIVLPQHSTVADAAEHLHKEWRKKLKYALLWGSGKFDGQRVGRDYVMADGDILELHD